MLHVAIEQQHVREVAGEDAREPGPHRVPLAEIDGVRPATSAPAVARPLGGAVGRAIVDDDDVRRPRRGRPSTTAAMVPASLNAGISAAVRIVIVRRPVRSSAGSTSTDAAASVTTLTADTMPIERSGGYDDQTSVP